MEENPANRKFNSSSERGPGPARPVAACRSLRELLCLANVAGTIYAVDDDCTHTSGALDQGELEGYILTCPLHLAQFDVRTGTVLRGPARDDLPTYSVRMDENDVLVEETAAD